MIVFADAIPKGATGKVQRHKLAETFGVKIRTR
jgi:acyl-coenzyme A synthetase/AMP-(fatty) acid ligase